MSAYQQLEAIFSRLYRLSHLQSIASWDQAVNMPAGGSEARAAALSTLDALMHEMLMSPALGQCLEQVREQGDLTAWQSANVQIVEKKYVRAKVVPAALIEKRTQLTMASEFAWREMRAANNWAGFMPLFEKSFEVVREVATLQAEALGLSVYDCLIDEYSPGFSQAIIDPIFTELKIALPQKIIAATERQRREEIISIAGVYPIEKQRALGLELMQTLGFDFNHGRLDISHHPFCGGVPEDVRITTRYNEQEFLSSMMGVCHETGHARYEQQLPKDWREQPVGHAMGMAVHESQSLLVEMYACRSHEFMQCLSPIVIRHFGDNPGFSADNLYKVYNQVAPGLIRVDADKLTYPMHVILRYELEQQLFSGELRIKDLPEAWHQGMQQHLQQSTLGNDKEGVMQDVHWPAGIFGYFPAYTLGSLIAAQLYQRLLQVQPTISVDIAQGDFSALFQWLQQHIHARASSVDVNQLLVDATGETLSARHFLKTT